MSRVREIPELKGLPLSTLCDAVVAILDLHRPDRNADLGGKVCEECRCAYPCITTDVLLQHPGVNPPPSAEGVAADSAR